MSSTAACTILVISSAVDTARQFVERIKGLSNPLDTPTSQNIAASSSSVESGLAKLHAELTNAEPAVSIPWTISNKYYTADVHFELRQLDSFAGYLASEVPAVVYVWNHGEQYRKTVPELAKKLEHYDPEVSLAVHFDLAPSSSSPPEQVAASHVDGDEQGLDEFISSHGFEYIDGDRGRRRPTQDGGSFSDEDDPGVPGLPRVIDALSTIMWPSLVQTARTTQRKSRAGDLLDWAAMEDVGGGDAPLLRSLAGDQLDTRKRMQKEIDQLENWLQQDLDHSRGRVEINTQTRQSRDDPWSTVPSPGGDAPLDHADGSALGFEDDFDEFVGAPMDVTYGDKRPVATSSSAAAQRTFTNDFLPGSRALAKGGQNYDDLFDYDDDDPDLPSHAEIEEMSKRLFGSAFLGPPSTSHTWTRLHSPLVNTNSTDLPDGNDGPSGSSANKDHAGFSRLGDELAPEGPDGENFELDAFDLSKVLGALQGMKEEISYMEDEDERRKAAAKVALGLVYGLRKEEYKEHESESA